LIYWISFFQKILEAAAGIDLMRRYGFREPQRKKNGSERLIAPNNAGMGQSGFESRRVELL
jgi:hypothetical protein